MVVEVWGGRVEEKEKGLMDMDHSVVIAGEKEKQGD